MIPLPEGWGSQSEEVCAECPDVIYKQNGRWHHNDTPNADHPARPSWESS